MVHVFREANKCVDALAKEVCSLLEDFVVFDVSPIVEISSFVNFDASGMYYFRLSTATLASSVC